MPFEIFFFLGMRIFILDYYWVNVFFVNKEKAKFLLYVRLVPKNGFVDTTRKLIV